MYSYIYDSFLNDKKYEKTLARLENRVTDLGINGHIHKLTILKSLREIVEDEIESGTKTIVVVGNDNIVSQVIDYVAKKDITLGIIPIGTKNMISNALGINNENAIENLSKRIIRKLDLGKVNDMYFLSSLQAISTNSIVQSSGYKIAPRFENYNIDIYNLVLNNEKPIGDFSSHAFDPLDGVLEAVIYKAGKKSFINRLIGKQELDIATFLPFKKLTVKKQKNTEAEADIADDETPTDKVLVDGQKIIKTPLKIEVVPGCLSIIVGKDRRFGEE